MQPTAYQNMMNDDEQENCVSFVFLFVLVHITTIHVKSTTHFFYSLSKNSIIQKIK